MCPREKHYLRKYNKKKKYIKIVVHKGYNLKLCEGGLKSCPLPYLLARNYTYQQRHYRVLSH